MTETIKKAKPAAKPRKAPTAKKKAASTGADPITNGSHGMSENHSTMAQQPAVSHEEVARLAHKFWKERGHKHGHHEEDWYRAERELRGVVS
jgi:DUF2934 family protein